MLKGKKILLAVTGSIAAYKSVYLLRYLQKQQCEVKVVMTSSAADFVSPLTFSSLSGERVLIDFFDNQVWENHAILGRWADMMIIAPASCHTISKMAHGLCDNLLLAIYLSANCPVVVAPAMDEDMWKHPSTLANITILKENGNLMIPVNSGPLASGLEGEGRMAEPMEIVTWIQDFFSRQSLCSGKKVLVTSGPTYEYIDPVRFIGNRSSGKMGIYLAEEFKNCGAEVTLVLGPSSVPVAGGMLVKRVVSARQMYEACMENLANYDVIVMAAAVADYTPITYADQKIKKKEDELNIRLSKTPDILADAGKRRSAHQLLVGFALETHQELENAKKKLTSKNADFIVLNSLNNQGAGFDTDTNKITMLGREGEILDFPLTSKRKVATNIVSTLMQSKYV